MSICVLIPAYRPCKSFITLVQELKNNCGFDVLVVDDGSGNDFKETFDAVAGCARVISYEKNMGKGYALKTGFRAVSEIFPDATGVVTADADCQHSVQDIAKVAALVAGGSPCVLSARKLGRDIPARSKFGNDLSRFVFAASTGRYFYDNQSGLRGFAISECEWLATVSGNRYDYEMAVLLHIDKSGIPVTVLPIETIYNDNNAESHFNPVKDTGRIYGRFIKTLLPSFICGLLVMILTVTGLLLVEQKYESMVILGVGFVFMFLSILFNKLFIFKRMSKAAVFRSVFFGTLRLMFSMAFCFGLSLCGFPCWVAFIISHILLLPIRFFVPRALRKSELTGGTVFLD